MADSVTTQTLFKGDRRAVFAFTNVSDSTGETAVAKVDLSDVFPNASKLKINKVIYDISGMKVKLSFDHDADDDVLVLSGEGACCLDFTCNAGGVDVGGLHDPASAGGTGDLLFTTIGAAANDTYTIILDVSPGN